MGTNQWEVTEDEPAVVPDRSAAQIALDTVPENPDQTLVSLYEERSKDLAITDDRSLRFAAELVEQCKLASKRVEEKRTLQTNPLNEQLKEINGVLIPLRDAFKKMADVWTDRIGRFIEARRQADAAAQAQANREAAARQAELDRQAAESRERANAAAASGDTSAAIKAESKAITLEQKAASTVAPVVPAQSRTVDLGTSKLGLKAPKRIWNMPGWDGKKPLPLLDPLLSPLVGDISQLPPSVQFLLQHADLNPVYLNASYKRPGTKFPAPFGESESFTGQLRSA